MSTLQELIDEGKRHTVTFKNRAGGTLLELSLLWTVIIAIAAPQLLPLLAILFLLDVIKIEYDDRAIGLTTPKDTETAESGDQPAT